MVISEVAKNGVTYLQLEDCTLGRGSYRNFAGERTPYNKSGKRTFVIFCTENEGLTLQNKGWYVRWREPRNDEDDRMALLTPECRFDKYPPKIKLITGNNHTLLDETNISILDTADISRCDLLISPFTWEDDNGKKWYKGFVHAMYVTLQDDDFGGRYSDL